MGKQNTSLRIERNRSQYHVETCRKESLNDSTIDTSISLVSVMRRKKQVEPISLYIASEIIIVVKTDKGTITEHDLRKPNLTREGQTRPLQILKSLILSNVSCFAFI